MKVSLISANQISFQTIVPLFENVGILSLGAILKDNSFPIQLIDISHYTNLYQHDFDLLFNQIAYKLLTSNPDIIGISTMSNTLPFALEIAKRVKQEDKSIKIVMGGSGVSFCPDKLLKKFHFIDYIMKGESEESFPKFLDYLRSKIPVEEIPEIKGLAFRKGDQIIDYGWPDPIKDLDQFPLPLYELCSNHDMSEIHLGRYSGIGIELGRGCVYNCTFCSTTSYFKRIHRLKSIPRILEEVKKAVHYIGLNQVAFHHDLITLNNDYINKLCDEFKIQFSNITWSCNTRLNTINPDLLKKMYDSGCREIFFGLEGTTEKMQKLVRKNLKLGELDSICNHIVDLGFHRFSLSCISGIPGTDKEDMISFFNLALKYKSLYLDQFNIQLHTLMPGLGSELYRENKDNLVYDTYGSITTTHIPEAWGISTKLIEENPDIFSIFHHIEYNSTHRLKDIKYVLLAICIDTCFKTSLSYSYKLLGERLPLYLVDQIDRIPLPKIGTLETNEYFKIGKILKYIIIELLNQNQLSIEIFSDLIEYELKSEEVLNKKESSDIKFMESKYDIFDLIEKLHKSRFNLNQTYHLDKNFYSIFWDHETEKVKCKVINKDFYHLMTNSFLAHT